MHIINGRKVAKEITGLIRQRLSQMPEPLSFHCLLVGDDPASHLYVRRKEKMARSLGITFTLHHLPADASVESIIKKTNELNQLQHGYIIQLPLPPALRPETNDLLQHIDPAKDADGLTEINRNRFLEDLPGAFLPTPVAAVMALVCSLEDSDYSYLPFMKDAALAVVPEMLQQKKAVIISDGDVFGPTLAVALERAGMSPSVVRSDSPTCAEATVIADLVVSAVGKPGLINGAMVQMGAVIIDVGTTLVQGHTVGDVDWQSISNKAYAATPVPGGVGPVTVAMLYANLLYLATRKSA
ncbi:MAG: bifunctional 5,10-methylenetetrahydrofolate dehydrogenase/5,10-methenyltetrahydrofolate cyclohydrolase [Patescibacteria group bacterium]|jgi:methylenetetrahydrofolate dehydrogenase (NADP+)/methenyltetrahydrofolate cyclohydrolase